MDIRIRSVDTYHRDRGFISAFFRVIVLKKILLVRSKWLHIYIWGNFIHFFKNWGTSVRFNLVITTSHTLDKIWAFLHLILLPILFLISTKSFLDLLKAILKQPKQEHMLVVGVIYSIFTVSFRNYYVYAFANWTLELWY